MLELLCIISMALCKVLVLVNVGILQFFIYPGLTEGGFHVTFQDRYFFFVSYRHCPSDNNKTKKSPKALPLRGGLLSESLGDEKLEKVFQPKVDKAAVAGSSRGHISAARTDPDTPDPPDKQRFSLTGAIRFWVGGFFFFFFLPHLKSQSIQIKSQTVNSVVLYVF